MGRGGPPGSDAALRLEFLHDIEAEKRALTRLRERARSLGGDSQTLRDIDEAAYLLSVVHERLQREELANG